jgi:O-antigen ligase
MANYDVNFVFIALGLLLLILSISNLYWGTFVIILAQPFFFTASSEAGVGATKLVFGALFGLWFVTWGLTRALRRNSGKSPVTHSMAAPALAFGGWLGLSILLGLAYGSSPGDIIRDLSQFVGYLAVLPLLDLVRTPGQAKKLIFFLVLLGLPSSILGQVGSMAAKQEFDLPTSVQILRGAGSYWGPFQGAVWVVAVSFPGLAMKLLAWGLLLFETSLSVFSGIRHKLLMFIIAAMTAFAVSGRLPHRSLLRYLIPVILTVVVGGIVADLSGLVTLPLSNITRDRYSTLMSEKELTQDNSMQGRFRESRWLFEKFLQNPVTGIGLGHALDDPTIPGGYNFRFHNGYLANLMKFGLVGSIIFLWYFLALLRQAFEVARVGDNYFAKVIGLGLVIWLVPVLASSVATNSFALRGFALTVGIMAGLLPALAFSRQPSTAENGEATTSVRPALGFQK